MCVYKIEMTKNPTLLWDHQRVVNQIKQVSFHSKNYYGYRFIFPRDVACIFIVVSDTKPSLKPSTNIGFRYLYKDLRK